MNKAMQIFLKAFSDPETKLDVQKSRRLMNLKMIDPFKGFYRTLDTRIYHEDHEVPMRIYFPNEESYDTVDIEEIKKNGIWQSIRSMWWWQWIIRLRRNIAFPGRWRIVMQQPGQSLQTGVF